MAWKKGKGKYPLDWDKVKSEVMHRAKYRCEECGRVPDNFKKNYKATDSDAITTRHFRVHHIDAHKSNNALSNLAYVCVWCHGKLHSEINSK